MMDKSAQERSILNKLREKANITGKILESVNPEFQKMMEKLRSTDERIRQHAQQVKPLVKSAKSLLNRRDYLSAASALAAFHERAKTISAELTRFEKSVDLKHYEFLLDQFDDEQKEQLFGYDPTKEPALSADDGSSFVALEAQAASFWFNSTDPLADVASSLSKDRMTAMRALEKRFSISFLKDLKQDSLDMFIETQKFMQFMIALFKKLATALAKRNVDQYVGWAKKYAERFNQYHEKFSEYYKKNIVPLKEQNAKIQEQKRLMEEQKARQLEEAAEQKRQQEAESQQWRGSGMQGKLEESIYEPQTNLPKPYGNPVQTQFPDKDLKKSVLDKLDEQPQPQQELPFDPAKFNIKSEFINKITKIADNDDARSLVLEILSFSEKLENEDPDASLKLLAIAEGIMDDFKGSKPANDIFKLPTPANDIKSPLV